MKRDPANSDQLLLVKGHGLPELLKQIVLVGLAVLLYFAVRGQTEGAESAALENGRRVLDFERDIGLAVEQDVQSVFASSRFLTTLVNWAYIWLHWPVIIASLLWLHRYRRFEYLLLRNAMFISGAVGLLIFIRFPVAPPRLLPGFVDTVTEFSTSYRILQPPNLVNKYAAVPSLHVGWNLLVGVVLYRIADRWPLKSLAVLSPIVMSIAVVATANHYLVDAFAGIAVSLAGLAVAVRVTSPIANLNAHLPVRYQAEIVEDDATDTEVVKQGDGGPVLDRPSEEQTSSKQSLDHSFGEQTAVDHRSINLRNEGDGWHPKQQRQFDSVARRFECADSLHLGKGA